MKFAGIIENDFSAAPGVSFTVFLQGCPHHCTGCHNPETWDFNGGKEFTNDIINKIIIGLTANGIQRTLCIMGGEPLCQENEFLTNLIIIEVKKAVPNLKIYLWTGYTIEELLNKGKRVKNILSNIDILIDGPYIENLRDITLPLRGSSNQRILNMREFDFSKKI